MAKISFWELLTKYEVVIPIIQRDYAQGRRGKEHIREKFLTQIKNALDDSTQSGELDFVYGTTKNKSQNEIIFYPLDGQQRLTTLWLLHWFIASKAGKLNEAKETLKKFSYETRTSSREFCQKLCEFDISNISNVADAVQKQKWFYAAWKQDPTIQSMLRMIEGTDKKNKNGNDFIDGIEEAFQCYDGEVIESHLPECRYIEYWNKLTGCSCPIKFSKLEINSTDLPVSDDLYIKMNARGKPLSDFENFKADLISSLSEGDAVTYGSLIDNDWTNCFWNKNEIDLFDSKWMAFLCRVAVCVKIENSKNNTNEGIAAILKDWRVYKDDHQESFVYQYKDFRDFQDIFNSNILGRLKNIFAGWKKLSSLPEFSLASAWNDNFDFIPVRKEKSVSTLTMKTRVLFYGTMLFCGADETNKEDACLIDKWNAWKRVMWNLAENTNESSTIDGFVGVIKMINQLAEGCLDIYNYLTTTPLNDFKFDQLKEEIDKATQIIEPARDCKWNCCGPDYRKIQEAESTAFFNGAIRFLYRDEKGETKWNGFTKKFENAKQYFEKNGVCSGYQVKLIQTLISQSSNWLQQIYDKKIFNPDAKNWKHILCSSNWQCPVHNILMSGILPLVRSADIEDENAKNYVQDALKNFPYEWVINKWSESRIRWSSRLACYPPYCRDAITFDWENFSRNKLLHELSQQGVIEIENQHKIEGCEHFFVGWHIGFQYKEMDFLWTAENIVYILDNNERKERPNTHKNQSAVERFYCFEAPIGDDIESFRNNLDALVSINNKSTVVNF